MRFNFPNLQPLKVAAIFLAVISVVVIVGAAVTRLQSLWGKSVVYTDGGQLPSPPSSLPQNVFFGYSVSPLVASCVSVRVADMNLKERIKSLFSSKSLVDEFVAVCETENAQRLAEQNALQQKAAEQADQAEKESEGVALENLPVVTLPSFTVKWLVQPEKFSGIPYLPSVCISSEYHSNSCFKVGDTSTGDDVIYSIENGGIMGMQFERWIRTSKGIFVLLEKQSTLFSGLLFDKGDFTSGKLARDPQSKILGIDTPDVFEYAGMQWKRAGGIFAQDVIPFSDINNNEEKPSNDLASLPFGELFSREKNNETYSALGSVNYFVRTADGLYLNYNLDDGLADDGTLTATWKSGYGSLATKSFVGGIKNGGCGSTSDNRYYPGKKELEKYEKAGDLKRGSTLYSVPTMDSAIFEYLYKDVQYSAKPETSREEFAKHVTILLSPDPFGRGYLFYSSIDDPNFMLMAECAKPVIYLYPKKTTDVSVKVGAHITKSEPEYGSGWKVTAEPDGTLRNRSGARWSSLFWDGTGYGEYPTIREGKVVSRADIQEVLKSDLAALGLNKRESADFLDFWLPHMPNTSFIRLTWLTMSEMNNLAPLVVSPRPNTIIRVFLDFSGQETSATNLEPQILTTVPREGFTLVEWGGLLRSDKTRP